MSGPGSSKKLTKKLSSVAVRALIVPSHHHLLSPFLQKMGSVGKHRRSVVTAEPVSVRHASETGCQKALTVTSRSLSVGQRRFALGGKVDQFGGISSERKLNRANSAAERTGGPSPAPKMGGRIPSSASRHMEAITAASTTDRLVADDLPHCKTLEGRRNIVLSNVVREGFICGILEHERRQSRL